MPWMTVRTRPGGVGRRDTDALEKSWGSPEEDEATEEAGVCAGDMVGGSIFLSVILSVSV